MCAALVLVPPAARLMAQDPAETPARVFDAQSFTLPNGMEVVLVENHRAPVVTHMVWYKAGAADEPSGHSGIAHFLEHLMFKGTDDLAPGAFSKRIRAMGGNDNAFTSQDYTAYYQSISRDHLADVMEMEADRMRDLAPPPEHVATEHAVVIEERRQRVENDPHSALYEQMRAALFVNHPYGTPVLGWMDEMEKLNWEEAHAFYRTWYAPNNAILVVSGDVTMDELRPLAERIYGTLPPEELPASRARPNVPPFPSDIEITKRSSAVRQPVFQRLYRVPGAGEFPELALAFDLAAEILGGGPTSRLYRALVIDQGLATNAGLSYNADVLNDAVLSLYATPAEGVETDRIAAAFDEELRRAVRDGFTGEELADARARLQAAAIYARDSLQGPAMVIGRALTTGQSLEEIETWPQRLEAVTLENLRTALEIYMNPDASGRASVTGYLLPDVLRGE